LGITVRAGKFQPRLFTFFPFYTEQQILSLLTATEWANLLGKQIYKPVDSYFFSWNNYSLKLGYWQLRCWHRANIPLPSQSYFTYTLWEGCWVCLTWSNSQLEHTDSISISEYHRQQEDNQQFRSEKLFLLTAAREDFNVSASNAPSS